MSTEGGDAGAAWGEARGSPTDNKRHTWEESDPLGSQGRPQPDGQEKPQPGEDEEEEEEEEEGRARAADDGKFREDNGGNTSSEEGAVGGRSDKAIPSTCSSDTCIPTPSCRICFQGAEQGDLLNPCRCDGSVRYTHQQCLLKWISERGCWTCELCCYRFQVIAINMKRPWQWQSITITLVEKVQIIAVFLGSLFLVASISWLLWSALSPQAIWQRRDVLFQICYGMYGFMDLVCVGLIVHEGAAVYNVFMRWRAVNLHWDVQSYDKAKDMEETSTAHSSLGPRTLWLPLTTLGPGGPLHPTQLGSRPWTCLCLAPFCRGLVPRNNLSQDADSGEVVIRVTSV
ncbi:E3 ubiquitin-protein ligase MARCHF11 isoform X2 [Cyprinodon tularosa]|uniref:RING-type E3 ubiquitin transferase n=2 Tax=Cyprinodontiformes TaxID=28738 RepID=A0A3Q2E070_CYPVA|nr:PREDICTED: E3 ubiquitin-protein ligase MARCH11 isoform X2 [Cyprinodon variegatus]XP_038142077.1 E3 ubiquitin-protein ligase MARCHF11 isoform X2 [Cyprinodon tularosa]